MTQLKEQLATGGVSTGAPFGWNQSCSRSRPWAYLLAVLLALFVLLPLIGSQYQLSVVLLLFMNIALAASWNLIGGYTGYFTFGHVAYFALGAYGAALMINAFELHWLLAALLAAGIATGIAALVGLPSLRVKGPGFVILTLAFSQALRILVQLLEQWTGGNSGISLPPAQSLLAVYFALGSCAVLAIFWLWKIDRSAFGRRLKAIRDDEFAAEAIGIDTKSDKVKAFVLSAVLPGFCGGVYAFYLGYINPDEVFSLRLNVSMIVMALLGGAGTVWGPVIGAILVFGVSELLWAQFPTLHQLVFGLLLVGLVVFMPEGILGRLTNKKKRTT